MPPRFYALADVAEILSISAVQAKALVRSGELPAIQVGGRNVWRVEASELEAYIQRKYAENAARVAQERARPEGGRDLEDAQDSEDRQDSEDAARD